MDQNPGEPISSWFDSSRHPTLQLGSLIFPAYIIPITASLSIPIWHYLVNLIVDDRKEIPDLKKHDLENDAIPSDENKWSSRIWPTMRDWTLHLFYSHWVFKVIIGIGSVEEDSVGLTTSMCISQAVVLLIATYLYDLPFMPPTLAATGWIGMALQHPPSLPAAVLIVCLALPYACLTMKPNGDICIGPELSGSLLVVLVADYYIPPESAIRSVKAFNCELWPHLMWIFAIVKHAFWTKDSTPAETTDGVKKGSPTKDDLLIILRIIVELIVGLVLPLAVGMAISNFSFTCLGWRWVVDGSAAVSPSLTGGIYLAYFIFMSVWSIGFMLDKRFPDTDDHRWWVFGVHTMLSSIRAMSWGVACFTAVYLILAGRGLVLGTF